MVLINNILNNEVKLLTFFNMWLILSLLEFDNK
jgi:hypothetical protein